MENPIYVALSRQGRMRRAMDMVANNLANANTPAYNSQRMLFVDHLSDLKDGRFPTRFDDVAFTQDWGTVRNTQTGPLTTTGNDLDMAIEGDGYFTIETPLGPRYSRNGRFQLNAEGTIVTGLGQTVLDAGGNPLTIPANTREIKVYPNGTVAAQVQGQGPVPVEIDVGQIQLVTFENQQEMKRLENGLYTGAGEPIESEEARLLQGMIENSNVNPILELAQMIEVSRTFGRGQQLMESEHDRLRRAIQIIARNER